MTDQYNFINHSVDGTSNIKVKDLNEFFDQWGPLEQSFDGGMVTSDGMSKLMPADSATRDALHEREKLGRQMASLPFNSQIHEELLGIDKEDLVKLVHDTTDPKTRSGVESNYGTAFFLDPNKPEDNDIINLFHPNNKVEDKLGLPAGSFHLKDSLVIEFENQVFVVDQRDEAAAVNDMLPRSIEKGQVLYQYQGEGSVFGVRVSGDKESIENLRKDSVDTGIYGAENTDIGGFTNSKDNPVIYLPDVIQHSSTLFVYEKEADTKEGSQEVFKISPATTMAAGSPSPTMYFLDSSNEVQQAKVGDYLMNKNVVSLNELSKDFIFENTEERAPMPF